MFYKSVNKNSDKEMFCFLRGHFKYATLNYWNNLFSIANNVKVYNLGLDYEILHLLDLDNYFTINDAIEMWEQANLGYKVEFNGRSGGYLVLYNDNNNKSVLDDYFNNDTYEEFKEEIKYDYGSLKEYHNKLVEQVELVQSFDKLCDDLLDICKDMLQNCKVVKKEKTETIEYEELEWN